MAPVERNAPCPCGSGQKAKRCCLPAGRLSTGETGSAAIDPLADGRRLLRNSAALLFVAVLVGGGVAWWHETQTGVAVAGLVVLLGAFLHVFLRPPPPKKDTGDPAALNFGK